jgi:hypothetical protein
LIVVVVVVDVVVVGATVVVVGATVVVVAVVVVGATLLVVVGATVVVVVVVVVVGLAVVVVVRDDDFGTQIRFLPTKTQTCAAPPMVRTAPTREHAPAAACIGAEGENTVSNTAAASAATRCRWLLLLVRLESKEYFPSTSSPT